MCDFSKIFRRRNLCTHARSISVTFRVSIARVEHVVDKNTRVGHFGVATSSCGNAECVLLRRLRKQDLLMEMINDGIRSIPDW